MPPKKGAKKGAKGKTDAEEFQDPTAVNPEEPALQQPPVMLQAVNQAQPSTTMVQQPVAQAQVNSSPQLVNIGGGLVQPHTSAVNTSAAAELSLKEKKELRKERFNKLGDNSMINTLDALDRMKEEKEKKLQRAQKFGLQTKDLEDEKRKQRALKFGLENTQAGNGSGHRQVNRQEVDEKKQQRAIRFGMGGMASSGNAEEDERKKKRLERFGGGSSIDQVPGARVVKRFKE